MRKLGSLLAIGLCLSASSVRAQSTPKPSPKLLPFSGTWNLDLQRSKIEAQRPSGLGQVVIEYDGKTWSYKHTQLNTEGKVQDSWDVTLVVGSTALHVEKEQPLTFHSRIYRAGETLILLETVRSDRGQTAHNTIRYSLEQGGNTLIEDEKSVSQMGTENNHWVLERVPAGTAAPFSQSRDPEGSDSR